LSDYEEVAIEDGDKKRFRFFLRNKVNSTLRIFRMYADTQKESLQWISAIEQVLKVRCYDNCLVQKNLVR
jgi:hypothetical protein